MQKSVSPSAKAIGYLEQALSEVDNVIVENDGKSRGVITCGGGQYSYGVYVSLKMARMVGWDGIFQIWHRGSNEPLNYKVFKELGAEIYDCSKIAKEKGIAEPKGWEAKAFACSNSNLNTIFFLDSDAYLLSDPTAAFDYADNNGELFWADDYNNWLQWDKFGYDIPEKTHYPVNGGQWVINKTLREKELKVYTALNRYGQGKLYNYMHGDQDCQRLAWYLTNQDYNIPCMDFDRYKGVWVYSYPEDIPIVSHRIGCKFAPEGYFPGRTFYGPVRGVPLEKHAMRFYTESLLKLGIPHK